MGERVNSGTRPNAGIVSGNRLLAPARLAENSLRAASALNDVGVWQGDVVALLMRNDFAYFEATAGAMRLGASTVPLNWHLKPDELAYILDDCSAKVLIAHTDLLTEDVLAICSDVEVIAVRTPQEVASAYGLDAARLDLNIPVAEWDRWITDYPPWTEQARRVTGPMFYTSGTTGRPKGVKRKPVLPEVAQRAEARSGFAFGMSEGPVRSVMTGPLYHSAPNAYGMRVVMDGGLLVLQPRFDAVELLSLVEEYRITHLHMVPTMFVRLLALPEETKQAYDLSSLRHVVHGAAPCPPEVKRAMIEWWGPVIHEYYALTETGIITSSDSQGWLDHPGSVGCPVPGIEILILDDENRRCDVGTAGEICVKSEVTSKVTYHRASDNTESMRRGDYVATGDVGYLDEDGYLYISDRKSDMVISGGVNIYPAEVENTLVTMSGVRDCAVFGLPDKEFGERLVAVVDAPNGLSKEKVKEFLKEKIAAYKVPREIFFSADLPREDSGKIKKRLLRDRLLGGETL